MSQSDENYLTFRLSQDEYGIAGRSVTDLIGPFGVVPMRGAPAYVQGLIAVRGEQIPVLDLGKKLGVETATPPTRATIIVVELSSAASDISLGLVVDELLGVCAVQDASVQLFRVGSGMQAPLVRGVTMFGTRVVFLLDIDQLLNAAERRACHELMHTPKPDRLGLRVAPRN